MDDINKIRDLLNSDDVSECRLGLELYDQLEGKGGLCMEIAAKAARTVIWCSENKQNVFSALMQPGIIPTDPREYMIVTGKIGYDIIDKLLKKDLDAWNKRK